VTQALQNPRLAIVVGSSPGGFPVAELQWVQITTQDQLAPVLNLSAQTLSFSAAEGGASPASQTLSVSNTGGGTLNWTAVAAPATPAWLSVSPASGLNNGTLTVSADPTGLAAGTYTNAITVTAPGASNTPQTVNVTLTVSPPGLVQYNFNYANRTSLVAAGWDFLARRADGAVRDTEQRSGALVSYDQLAHPGTLWIPADAGDLWDSMNNTRNSLFRELPAQWVSARIKLSFAPTQSWQQAGILAYQDDDNYVHVTRIYEYGQKFTMARETGGRGQIVKKVLRTETRDLLLRLDRDPATELIIGYYSVDGTTWNELGRVTQALQNPRLAIVVGSSPGGFPVAELQWVQITANP
jgi:hypothetical protein